MPTSGRVPGLLAMLSLLLAPAGGRCLGALGLVGAVAAAVFAV